ncbi:hypothetical protein PENSPDRAFT_653259 [Peniophora sp. CONT]|nr:hypothetical protein PENSPDRAFT_653259 [Peniophora sp. CONT]
MTSEAHPRNLQHEQSLPAFNTLSLPRDLAAIPASTRTSYTRVDMSRPVTSAGPAVPADSDSDGADSAPHRPHTTAATSTGRFVRNNDEETDSHVGHEEEAKERSEEEARAVPQTPQASVTFLLVNGKRRTMQFEPETTVGRVKELVWNTWPNDWQDQRPPAPSYFRILHLGKVLQDDDTLSQLNFATYTAPAATPPSTIVHLSIRAVAPPSDDGSKKKGSWMRGSTDGEEAGEHGGCTCCIIC